MKPTFKNQLIEAVYNVQYLNKCKDGIIPSSVVPHILDELISKWTVRHEKLVSLIPKDKLLKPKYLNINI